MMWNHQSKIIRHVTINLNLKNFSPFPSSFLHFLKYLFSFFSFIPLEFPNFTKRKTKH